MTGSEKGRSAAARRGVVVGVAVLLAASCGAEPDPRLELGRAVFTDHAQPKCTICHTLADAGSTANVGPNLDLLKPDSQRVAAAVTNGIGIMPAQGEHLTPEQIGAVAYYLSRVTRESE